MKTFEEYEVRTLTGIDRYAKLGEARRSARYENGLGKHATIYSIRINRYGEVTDREEVVFTRPNG